MEKNKKKNNIIDFPRKKSKLEREIEAIIFAAEEPMEYQIIFSINNKVDSTINALKERYENNHYYFQLFLRLPSKRP